ncbi:MAG: hypothetical protein HY266_01630 [Deltaproteobacteria bacterium]|nr:hypothetical protein [Deltaproteobacteria bacterium]
MNDTTKEIFLYALTFIGLLAVIFVGGRYVQRLPSHIKKKINQISFGVAAASGILLYIFHYAVLLYLFLVSLVCFFLFFNYKEEG